MAGLFHHMLHPIFEKTGLEFGPLGLHFWKKDGVKQYQTEK